MRQRRFIVIYGSFFVCCLSTCLADEKLEIAFGNLTLAERKLLKEYELSVKPLVGKYENLAADYSLTESFHKKDSLHMEKVKSSTVSVFRKGKQLRAEMQITRNGQTNNLIDLCDGDTAWNLAKDNLTNDYFLEQHAKQNVDCSWGHWWIYSPYSFRFHIVPDLLLKPSTSQTIESVRPFVSEAGDRLVEVRVKQIVENQDKRHASPSERFVFYRDVHWALREVEQLSYVNGRPLRVRTLQQVHYEPFSNSEIPILKQVTVDHWQRDLGAEKAWIPVRSFDVTFDRVDFTPPPKELFEISSIIDYQGRLHKSRGLGPKSYFAFAGMLLLCLWYLLRRRGKKDVTTSVKSG